MAELSRHRENRLKRHRFSWEPLEVRRVATASATLAPLAGLLLPPVAVVVESTSSLVETIDAQEGSGSGLEVVIPGVESGEVTILPVDQGSGSISTDLPVVDPLIPLPPIDHGADDTTEPTTPDPSVPSEIPIGDVDPSLPPIEVTPPGSGDAGTPLPTPIIVPTPDPGMGPDPLPTPDPGMGPDPLPTPGPLDPQPDPVVDPIPDPVVNPPVVDPEVLPAPFPPVVPTPQPDPGPPVGPAPWTPPPAEIKPDPTPEDPPRDHLPDVGTPSKSIGKAPAEPDAPSDAPKTPNSPETPNTSIPPKTDPPSTSPGSPPSTPPSAGTTDPGIGDVHRPEMGPGLGPRPTTPSQPTATKVDDTSGLSIVEDSDTEILDWWWSPSNAHSFGISPVLGSPGAVATAIARSDSRSAVLWTSLSVTPAFAAASAAISSVASTSPSTLFTQLQASETIDATRAGVEVALANVTDLVEAIPGISKPYSEFQFDAATSMLRVLNIQPTAALNLTGVITNFQGLLASVQSESITRFVHIAAFSPVTWVMLGVVVGVSAEVARREIRNAGKAAPGDGGPDLFSSWEMS